MTYRPNPAYQVASQSGRTDNINPVEDKPVAESLVDTTNLPVALAYYYPSATGVAMTPYQDLSFTGKFITDGSPGTVEMTVEAMNDEDATLGDWVDVTRSGYRTDTDTSGNTSVISTNNQTLIFGFDFDNFNYDRYRVRIDILVSAVNTVIVKQRRKAL